MTREHESDDDEDKHDSTGGKDVALTDFVPPMKVEKTEC